MNRTKYDDVAKTTFTVKSEESLELLKAFLMIEDPKLRADIISISFTFFTRQSGRAGD
jgi:hypothetical protein